MRGLPHLRYLCSMSKKMTRQLLKWFASHHRPMPWKGEKNPYLIWLSEIILQQTRVAQGLPYFEKFKETYPTINDLAAAPEDEVFKLWEGLGYYSRARNLHATAKNISTNMGGKFPDQYEEILKLKGVGPYTAAAIASFAYELPYAVLDGNVFRVLSRYFGIHTPIDSTAGKKEFAKLAQQLLSKKHPADYNQAIMDFGATQCIPKNPECKNCPFQKDCVAYREDLIDQLPVKEKKLKKRTRHFQYLIFNIDEQVWIHKRTEKDIWQGLYDFPLIETNALLDQKMLWKNKSFLELVEGQNVTIDRVSRPFSQQLTHQKIHGVFFEIQLSQLPDNFSENWKLISRTNLPDYAFPRIIDLYLQDNSLYLNF